MYMKQREAEALSFFREGSQIRSWVGDYASLCKVHL